MKNNEVMVEVKKKKAMNDFRYAWPMVTLIGKPLCPSLALQALIKFLINGSIVFFILSPI